MDIKNILKELTSAVGVSGKETDAVLTAQRLLSEFGKTREDVLHSAICEIEGDRAGHILIDAHIDRIGLIVTSVTDEGFLHVAACGGVDRRTLNGQEVTVYGSEPVFGVIASTPPHLASGDNERKATEIDDILIDIGAKNKQSAEKLVSPGDRAVVNSSFLSLCGDSVSCGALDDRSGIAVLLRALELINGKPHKKVTVVCSSREETSGGGAKSAAFNSDADEIIAVDVSFAKTPDSKAEECGILGKGPMIGISPSLSYEFSEELVRVAEKNDIPYQLEVMGGRTGTNLDGMTTERGGIKSALISIPQKYMHTGIEVVSVTDIELCARLIAAYILGGDLNA